MANKGPIDALVQLRSKATSFFNVAKSAGSAEVLNLQPVDFRAFSAIPTLP